MHSKGAPKVKSTLSFQMAGTKCTLTVPQFQLECGAILGSTTVCYRAWGTLNDARNNVMIICHPFTGSPDVDKWSVDWDSQTCSKTHGHIGGGLSWAPGRHSTPHTISSYAPTFWARHLGLPLLSRLTRRPDGATVPTSRLQPFVTMSGIICATFLHLLEPHTAYTKKSLTISVFTLSRWLSAAPWVG